MFAQVDSDQTAVISFTSMEVPTEAGSLEQALFLAFCSSHGVKFKLSLADTLCCVARPEACAICCEHFVEADRLRLLPCLHRPVFDALGPEVGPLHLVRRIGILSSEGSEGSASSCQK